MNRSVRFASGEGDRTRPLEGKAVGIYFTGTSTRTHLFYYRRAPQRSGDHHYGPRDLQIVTGETIADTARVLAGFLDALVIRTNDSIAEMEAFAEQDEMAIINAMSEGEHPTQAIADLSTLKETFGRLEIFMCCISVGKQHRGVIGAGCLVDARHATYGGHTRGLRIVR